VVSLPPWPSAAAPAGRHTWRRAALVGAVTTACAVASLWPMWSTDFVTGVINLLGAVSFLVTAAVIGEDPGQRGNARALALCGLFWLVSWWSAWLTGPGPLLSETFGYLWFVFGGLALLRYPDAVLTRRSERLFLIGLGVWVCGAQLTADLFSRPEWSEFDPSAWWPALYPDLTIYTAVMTAFYVVTGLAVLIMLGFLIAKLRRVRGIDRIDAVPVTVAAGSVAVVGGVYMVTNLLPHSDHTIDVILTLIGLTLLITPLAFLTTVTQRRLVVSSVADLVLGLPTSPTVAQVQDALREVLRDPTAALWLWLPVLGTYVDAHGETACTPPTGDQWSVPVRGRDGEPLAVLLVDQALRRHPRLVRSAIMASGLSLENGRLRADLETQLAEVRASRARIAEAGMVERRRIERDIHDGAQQSILAAAATLGVARMHSAADAKALQAIDQARSDLQTALRDLRDLARGIHPAILSQSGLNAALEDVIERIPIPVELSIADRRWSAPIESTLYFLTCEALTNTVKHARAKVAVVEIRGDEAGATVTVVDDGLGGASIPREGGLAGIADRARALGGTFDIRSPLGVGTTITASIPCG
jgi:signal transduction histidine kinase